MNRRATRRGEIEPRLCDVPGCDGVGRVERTFTGKFRRYKCKKCGAVWKVIFRVVEKIIYRGESYQPDRRKPSATE